MARPIRLKLAKDNVTYHVMVRTAGREFIFEDPSLREWIYKKIVSLSHVYYVNLHSITIMSNHFHIILSVRKPKKDEAELKSRFELLQQSRKYPKIWREWLIDPWYVKLTDLSEFMKELNQSTAQYLNFVHKRSGHIWGGRFKSVMLEDGAALLTCMAYVEMNCVRAGMAEKPSDYRFCSVGRYSQGGKEAAGVTFPSLGMFDGLRNKAQHQRAFGMFVDHLAMKANGKAGDFRWDIEELQKMIDKQEASHILSLVINRSKWMVNSVILGSEAFCRVLIKEAGLQPGKYGASLPLRVLGHFYNSHLREGPPG